MKLLKGHLYMLLRTSNWLLPLTFTMDVTLGWIIFFRVLPTRGFFSLVCLGPERIRIIQCA